MASQNKMECPICNNDFDFKDHLPKILSCNRHIICKECLERILKKENPFCPFDLSNIETNIHAYKDCSFDKLLEYFQTSDNAINSKFSIDSRPSSFLNERAASASSINLRTSRQEIIFNPTPHQTQNMIRSSSNVTSKEVIMSELRNVLNKIGYDRDEINYAGKENWLGKFLQDFHERGSLVIDEYEKMFGSRDTVRLKSLIQTSENLCNYTPASPRNNASEFFTKEEIVFELNRIVQNLGYQSETWINEFIQVYLLKGNIAVNEFETKFGYRDSGRLKTLIQSSDKLQNFNKKIIEGESLSQDNSIFTVELNEILRQMNYNTNDYPWILNFVKVFAAKGIKGIDKFENKFGARDFKKIKNLILSSENLKHFSENLNINNDGELSSSMDSEDDKAPKPKEALKKMSHLLEDMDYNQSTNSWIKNFLSDFKTTGFDAIESYKSKFGVKDTKELSKRANNSKLLCNYNYSLKKQKIETSKLSESKTDDDDNKISDSPNDKRMQNEPDLSIDELEEKVRPLNINGNYNSFGRGRGQGRGRYRGRGRDKSMENKPDLSMNELEENRRPLNNNRNNNSLGRGRGLGRGFNKLNRDAFPSPLFDMNAVRKVEKEITVLVIGATGAGKSSLINLLYLWSLNINDLRQVQEVLIPTKYIKGSATTESNDVTRQDQSQTQHSAVYCFTLETSNKVYNLSFMDTPGLGDVRGFQQDDINTDNILDTVSKTDEINCIILMINGAEPRVSDRIKYIISRLVGIIPNVVRDNLIVLMSNVRFTPNLDYRVLGVNVPEKHVYFMDNLIFSIDLTNACAATINSVNGEFELLKNKFVDILAEIETLRFATTDNFRKLKEKRDLFKIEIDKVRMFLENKLKEKRKLEELFKEMIGHENQKNTLDLNKFKAETEEYWEDVNTDPVYNTRCITCKSNCHLRCYLDEMTVQGDIRFKRCQAFSGTETCTICKHRFEQHVHLRSKYEKQTRTKNVLDADIVNQIKSQDDLIKNKKKIMDNIKANEAKLERDILIAKERIIDLLQELQSYCSDFNYVKELHLTKSLLEARIDYLQGEYGKTKEKNILDDCENAIKSKKIIEEMMRIMFKDYDIEFTNQKKGGIVKECFKVIGKLIKKVNV